MLQPDTLHHLWRDLQAAHRQLAGWQLVVNGRMTSSAGRCKYDRREIHVAAWHLRRSRKADVVDTLLHEAAHALAGPRTNHGPAWKQWAERLGADPSRALPTDVWRDSPAAARRPRWLARCRACDQQYRRQRRSRRRRLVCGRCGGALTWTSLPA
ncbi:MAG TPA: SprT-like domain-containing protein [Longimicrobiales bacterium]|nr:SprT-like domain-containing protein [Longimicrobiales bacterium]